MRTYSVYGFRYPDTITPPYPVAAIINERSRPQGIQGNCYHPDVWVLDYSFSDIGKFSLENLPWQERPRNTAHLYPPGRHYQELCKSADLCKSGFFLFKGDSPALRRLVDNPAGFAQINDRGLRICELIRAGAKAASKGNQGYWQLNAVFCQLMDILEHLSRNEDVPWLYSISEHPSETSTLPQKTAAFLEQNYRKKITLDKLAAEFQCSKSAIVHQFRYEYNESVIEMLMRIRVEQSIPLLIANCTLKEIADAVGFANEFYYSRVFRKITGVSPKKYRSRQ